MFYMLKNIDVFLQRRKPYHFTSNVSSYLSNSPLFLGCMNTEIYTQNIKMLCKNKCARFYFVTKKWQCLFISYINLEL